MRAREKVWIVRPNDGTTLGDILEKAGEDGSAISEGRVFIEKKRATEARQRVAVGDMVRIGARPADEARAIEILFRRDDLVACVKPAGLPTVPDHAGASHALVALVAKQLGLPTAELRVTSRLDREVSGVVVFALGDAAELRLREARAAGVYHRRYVALASPPPGPEDGLWDAPIGRTMNDPRRRAAHGREAKEATTRWSTIARSRSDRGPTVALLAVDPQTGRTHQIRVHASDAGAPLLGDRDYGGAPKLVLSSGRIIAPGRIGLHAARVVVPGAEGPLEARAPIPAELTSMWRELGGEDEAWERAITATLGDAARPR